jgi:hypothetical protein
LHYKRVKPKHRFLSFAFSCFFNGFSNLINKNLGLSAQVLWSSLVRAAWQYLSRETDYSGRKQAAEKDTCRHPAAIQL